MTGGRRLSRLAGIPVTELKGVGVRKAALLAELGIWTVFDLLVYYPRKWIDRTNAVPVGELVEGEEAVVSVVVAQVSSFRARTGRIVVKVATTSPTGGLGLTFFNQAWRANQLRSGASLVVFGRAERGRGGWQMTNPALDVVGYGAESDDDEPAASSPTRQTLRVVAIYPQSAKAPVSSSELTRYLTEALERAGDFVDPVPAAELDALGLIDRTAAFNGIHLPRSLAERDRARRRLSFDELLRLQLELVGRKVAAARDARGIAHAVQAGDGVPDLVGAFLGGLPFALTGAQRDALDVLAADLSSPLPMHRLLQGDVGSGKTVVALATLLFAVQGGYQGAVMVPTEVLAEQHYFSALELLAGLAVADPARLGGTRSVEVGLLTSRTGAAERARLHAGMRSGALDIVIGTHALIGEAVEFAALGAVVIDEQHRFGVDQRAALRDKGAGRDPDLLVMTATPIPRTAAMTVYGDLDQTVLDELPAGRRPVVTSWCETDDEESSAWARVRAEVAAGHRAFVVCPLVRRGDTVAEDADGAGEPADAPRDVEASARPPARAAEDEAGRLQSGELSGIAVGLLHGQMPARDKEAAMAAFRSGATPVLVATTVVEVGVDVPGATVMVIEDADRFGIAQLHQLRGRVGRGGDPSWCYLFGRDVTDEARRRLEALVDSNDGFALADVDLELRGEGTLLAARQKGRNDLKLASIRRDAELVVRARSVAERLVGDDPTLSDHPVLADELRLFIGDEQAEYLARS